MSLSFVSSAVLSSTDGVSHNEEKSIESREVQSLRKSAEHKPLFEQLRSNREAEQEKYDEMTKAMRGTRTLDEEDCAHLDAVEKQRLEREMSVKAGVEAEVAMFRAARADRGMVRSVADEEPPDGKEDARSEIAAETAGKVTPAGVRAPVAFVPKIVVKRKRKRSAATGEVPVSATGGSVSEETVPVPPSSIDVTEEQVKNAHGVDSNSKKDEKPRKNNAVKDEVAEAGLGGLLGGYGSSDESD